MKRLSTLLAGIAIIALSACSEKPQTADGAKSDSAPYTGTGKAYAEKNWKQGDKTSWESALKARAQNGQNDYNKVQ